MVRETLPLSPEVQKGPPCFLNFLPERSVGAAGSAPAPRLGQCLKDYICTMNPLHHLAKISKFTMVLITY